MKVYTSEQVDGLDKIILDSPSIAFCSQLRPNLNDVNLENVIKNNDLGCGSLKVEDLFPATNIYVTIGWNKNDDIFDKLETWSARKTPANKPFNMHHKPRDIIGHIIDSYGYTLDHKVIPDNISLDELPDDFHIVIQSVLYKSVDQRDSELKEEREQLIGEILDGLWYVSMECLFDDFDYGLQSSNGEQSIVKRSEDTAFLTKHLKAYGGSGAYGDAKLGRILRNQTYIGNGLVKNPANPSSIFLFSEANVNSFVGKIIDPTEVNIVLNNNLEGDSFMAEEYKDKINDLEKDLAEAHKRLREMDEQSVQAKLNEKDAEIDKRDAQVANIQKELDEMTASYNEAEKSSKAVEEEIETLKQELDKANVELATVRLASKKTDRISILINDGVDKAEAETVVDKFIDLDDEKFEDIVAMQKKIVASTTESTSDESSGDSKSDDEDEETSEEANADEDKLNDLTEEEEADLSAASDDVDEEKRTKLQALARDVSNYIRGSQSESDSE